MYELLSIILPEGMDLGVGLFLVVISFFTSASAAAFGMGGGVTLLAVMAVVLPVSALIPVHGVVQLGSNAGRTWRTKDYLKKDLILPFLVGAIAGAFLGGFVVVEIPEAPLLIALGCFILLIVWVQIPKLVGTSQKFIGAGGFITSILTMFLGATGPFIMALMANTLDDRKAVVANAAALMTAQHGLKIIAYGFLGFAFAQWLPLIAAMIATGYLGTITGVWMLGAMNEELFRKVFKGGVTLLALNMIRRGVNIY